jgi:hypothetical protein
MSGPVVDEDFGGNTADEVEVEVEVEVKALDDSDDWLGSAAKTRGTPLETSCWPSVAFLLLLSTQIFA